jgi:hypothetical protein
MRSGFEISPRAPVCSINCFSVRTKLLIPAFLNPSNSVGLKNALLSCSHIPKNSIVLQHKWHKWSCFLPRLYQIFDLMRFISETPKISFYIVFDFPPFGLVMSVVFFRVVGLACLTPPQRGSLRPSPQRGSAATSESVIKAAEANEKETVPGVTYATPLESHISR